MGTPLVRLESSACVSAILNLPNWVPASAAATRLAKGVSWMRMGSSPAFKAERNSLSASADRAS
eukprot:4138992-Alexandrium_andersonii.AAC.1